MTYQPQLDEVPLAELILEVERRRVLRSNNLCDYCGRIPDDPQCRFPDRHVRSQKVNHPAPDRAWIGVDFDGTLAEYHGYNGLNLGAPIPLMVSRVRDWLDQGKDVKIVTARVSGAGGLDREIESNVAAIKSWCLQHLGQELEVTCQKDYMMVELWDDRAVGVVPNTGEIRHSPVV